MSAPGAREEGGVIAWMVHNRVTPNLLMLVLLGGGLFMATKIKQEIFPSFDLDRVTVSVAYPGASPEEVERGIVLPVEEAVRGLDGVDEIHSGAGEGGGSVTLELSGDADGNAVRQEVQQAIDRIRTFPDDAEQPRVRLAMRRREVIEMVLFGDVSEHVLHELAEQTRDALLQSEEITQVDIVGGRSFEVHVDIPLETLRAHGLTLDGVAARIREASVERPGGGLETRGGEILLRVTDRRDWAREFAMIPILTSPGGTVLRLGELADVSEGFEDIDHHTLFNGVPSIGIEVFRVADQTPVGVAKETRRILHELESELPDGVFWDIHDDDSIVYLQRLELLLKNMYLGLVLVLVLLGLFLEARVAFWVTMGIPISFLGGLLFLSAMDVSINLISMFAFIVALGIVVDDAIVAGENIYEYRSRGMSFVQAAIEGAKDVAGPVGFSIITNIIAFLPLYFVPGYMGKIWRVIPLVVVTVFLISWVESLLILPSHLAHARDRRHSGRLGLGARVHRFFNRGVVVFAERVYAPILDVCTRWRYLTLATGAAVLIVTAGWVAGGRIGIILMPRVETDDATVEATLPLGSPEAEAERVRDQLLVALNEVVAESGGDQLLLGTLATINENEVEIEAFLQPPGVRPILTSELAQRWREAAGEVMGVERIRYEFDRGGPGSGAALTIELSHRDVATLERAAEMLATRLAEFPNVSDIDDGRSDGKRQFDFRLTPNGESLGLTSASIARQVRNAFYGAEALRQLRGANEVRVLVRSPDDERSSELGVEALMVATPNGAYVPLREVATVHRGHSFTGIERRGGRRVTNVTANVEPMSETQQVMDTLDASVLPQLVEDFPGLSHAYRGRQFTMKESTDALFSGFILALIVMYIVLAVPFRSYIQPLIVMMAIPFGFVGAVLGHVIMGYDISLISMMGLVALAGVLVNDSLLLVDYANKQRRDGVGARRAIREAGVRRFRPVLLTTLTTFGGLAPMIFETSRQARFMIPMAISLGFGILFATVITLILVPSLYMTIEDIRRAFGGLRGRRRRASPPGVAGEGV